MDRSRLAQRFTPWSRSTGVVPDWTWPEIQTALVSHEAGQFQLSGKLIDSMGRDDRIASHLDTLILGILRLPLGFRGPDDAVRSAFSSVFDRVWDEGKAYEWISAAVMAGVGLLEVDWDTSDPALWRPSELRSWSPEFYSVDATTGHLKLSTQEGLVDIDPCDLGGKWIILSPGGERGWLRGAVRQLAKPWLMRAQAQRDWARASERMGMGVLKAHVPTDADAAEKDEFFDSVANLPSEPVIQVSKPSDGQGEGWDVTLMETARDTGEHYEKRILRCETDLAVRLLGQNASTENSGPYVAKSGLFSKVTLDRIDGIVGPLERALLTGLARPFAELNFGDPGLAAYPDWDSEPPPDKAAQAQTMVSLSQAVSALSAAGYDLDAQELSTRFGFRLSRRTA